MKIVHVLYSGLGGHGNIFRSLVQGDYESTFRYEAIFNGIEEVRAEYQEFCVQHAIPFSFVPKRRGLDIRYYLQLFHFISKSEADIIFLHSSSYILPAVIATVFSKTHRRIIVRETQANHLKSKVDWAWLAVALVFSDVIVFLSQVYNDQIRKRLALIYKKKKVEIIPNGINLQQFKPAAKHNPGEIIIGMQSRIIKIKDHRSLLEAFFVLRNRKPGLNLKLRIAGDGKHKNAMENYTAELDLQEHVEFTGMLDEDDLVAFMHSLTIYVHASFGETMSTAIMQAMACGIPIIASDVDGINNMIEDGITGLLVPVKNKTELADAMERLLLDYQLQKTLIANALQYARTYFSNRRMFLNYNLSFQTIAKSFSNMENLPNRP